MVRGPWRSERIGVRSVPVRNSTAHRVGPQHSPREGYLGRHCATYQEEWVCDIGEFHRTRMESHCLLVQQQTDTLNTYALCVRGSWHRSKSGAAVSGSKRLGQRRRIHGKQRAHSTQTPCATTDTERHTPRHTDAHAYTDGLRNDLAVRGNTLSKQTETLQAGKTYRRAFNPLHAHTTHGSKALLDSCVCSSFVSLSDTPSTAPQDTSSPYNKLN